MRVSRSARDDTPFTVVTLGTQRGTSLPLRTNGHGGKGEAMTIRLANGGTLTVLESGTVEFRKGREYNVTPGRGSYAANVEWLESLATRNGSAVLFTTRQG